MPREAIRDLTSTTCKRVCLSFTRTGTHSLAIRAVLTARSAPSLDFMLRRSRLYLIALIVCMVPAAWLAIGVWTWLRSAQRQSTCTAHIQVICYALRNYHTDFGCYPPSVIRDSRGRAMHIWRVLLLRYLDQSLHDQYDFSEPWNGPNNSRLASRMPKCFACPNNQHSITAAETNYFAIVGPGHAFDGDRYVTLPGDITARKEIIVLVESSTHRVKWLEPKDLNLEEMSLEYNRSDSPSISSRDLLGPAIISAECQVYRYYSAPFGLRRLMKLPSCDIDPSER